MAETKYDKRFYDTVWGEAAGGSPSEIQAVAAVYKNLADKLGYEAALKKSVAYRAKSKQYLKAATGKLNTFERAKYNLNKLLIDQYLANPTLPYTAMENVDVFGEPKWAGDYSGYKDIGRQRFYYGGR